MGIMTFATTIALNKLIADSISIGRGDSRMNSGGSKTFADRSPTIFTIQILTGSRTMRQETMDPVVGETSGKMDFDLSEELSLANMID
jgi:hypothetical protein